MLSSIEMSMRQPVPVRPRWISAATAIEDMRSRVMGLSVTLTASTPPAFMSRAPSIAVAQSAPFGGSWSRLATRAKRVPTADLNACNSSLEAQLETTAAELRTLLHHQVEGRVCSADGKGRAQPEPGAVPTGST